MAFVTQYDVEVYQRLEGLIGRKLPAFECDEQTVLVLQERVADAQRLAAREMREEAGDRKKGKGSRRQRTEEEEAGGADIDAIVKSFKKRKGGGSGGGGKRGRR